MSKTKYQSDIILGETYIDQQSGFEGVATAIYFYQFGCERVNLEAFDDTRKQINSIAFDSPRLTNKKTGKTAKVTRTGGPGLTTEDRDDRGGIR